MIYRAPWRLIDVQLEQPLAPVERIPGAHGVTLTFWWRGTPLGQADVFAIELPLPAPQLASMAGAAVSPALAHYVTGQDPIPAINEWGRREWTVPSTYRALLSGDPFAVLEQRSAPPAPCPSLSVVVCTRDRPDDLERCLGSLAALDPPPLEIIVVDNAPGLPATRGVVERLGVGRYVAEPRPGLSAARNAGLAVARGDLIAFTDDDVTVEPQWAARLAEPFADPVVAVTTGLVLPAALETEAQLLFEHAFGGFGQGYRPLRFGREFFDRHRGGSAPVWSIGAGASMAVRRSVAVQLGGFDERLGAGAAGCSEDSELWYRVLAAGLECRYEPRAVVRHHHRTTTSALDGQMYQYMRGHVTAVLIQYANHGDRGHLRRVARTLPIWYARSAARALGSLVRHGRLRHRHRLLPAQIAGAVAGVFHYLRVRHRPAGGAIA